MTYLWDLAGSGYIAGWIHFGLATFRKGHYWMFPDRLLLPFRWIIGALIATTASAAARA
jgi:hypothetical protein